MTMNEQEPSCPTCRDPWPCPLHGGPPEPGPSSGSGSEPPANPPQHEYMIGTNEEPVSPPVGPLQALREAIKRERDLDHSDEFGRDERVTDAALVSVEEQLAALQQALEIASNWADARQERVTELLASEAALQRERDGWKQTADDATAGADLRAAEIAGLRTEVARLRDDAERWRWFRARAVIAVGEDGYPFIGAGVGDEDSVPGLTDEQHTRVMEDVGFSPPASATIVDAIADALVPSAPQTQEET